MCLFHPSREICPSFATRWPVDQEMIAEVDAGEIKYGGTLFPVAEKAQASVTRVPLSAEAEVSDPTCLNPRLANIPNVSWSKLMRNTFCKLSKKASKG